MIMIMIVILIMLSKARSTCDLIGRLRTTHSPPTNLVRGILLGTHVCVE